MVVVGVEEKCGFWYDAFLVLCSRASLPFPPLPFSSFPFLFFFFFLFLLFQGGGGIWARPGHLGKIRTGGDWDRGQFRGGIDIMIKGATEGRHAGGERAGHLALAEKQGPHQGHRWAARCQGLGVSVDMAVLRDLQLGHK